MGRFLAVAAPIPVTIHFNCFRHSVLPHNAYTEIRLLALIDFSKADYSFGGFVDGTYDTAIRYFPGYPYHLGFLAQYGDIQSLDDSFLLLTVFHHRIGIGAYPADSPESKAGLIMAF